MIDLRPYFELMDDDIPQRMKRLKAKIEPHMDAVLDHFYETVGKEPKTAEMLRRVSVENLKKAQKNHWMTLLSEGPSLEYIERVDRIGTAHEHIGLNPGYYIGGYAVIMRQLVNLTTKGSKRFLGGRGRQPLLDSDDVDLMLRIFNFDMAQSVLVYQKKADRMGEVLSSTIEFIEQLHGNLEQTAASVTEMNSTVAEINERSEEAHSHVGGLASRMTQVNAMMKDLHKASDTIGGVLGIIKEISEKTNLLSLNAAVESARAGEHGRGFSVVAGEVKKLANQTQTSVGDIGKEIQAIQERVDSITKDIDNVAKSVDELEGINTTITAAVHEQGAAMQEVDSFIQGVFERSSSTLVELKRRSDQLVKSR